MALRSRQSANLTSDDQHEAFWCNTHLTVVKLSFDWTIDNYSMVSLKSKERFESSWFSANDYDDIKWRMLLYPKGNSEENSEYISVFLKLEESDRMHVPILFAFSILDSKGQLTHTMKLNRAHKFPKSETLGFRKFIKVSELNSSEEDLLPGDRLQIHCDLRMMVGSISTSGKDGRIGCKVSESHLSEDFEKVLANRKFCDVVLVGPDGEEFPAHKAVLAGRSAVFASMFEHNMKESVQNRVEISDIASDVLREVLYYIYTGKAPSLSRKVEGLLIAADKYALDRLKELCEEHFTRNLSIDSAADVYVLADFHNATRLKACALDFICGHVRDFLRESSWGNLIAHHPNLAIDISKAIAAGIAEPPLKRMKPSSKNPDTNSCDAAHPSK